MAGYSGTPLVKKLGIREDMRLAFLYAPSHYADLLGPLPAGVKQADEDTGAVDFIHAFFYERTDFELALPALMKAIKRDGIIWISWPKKTSKVPTTMSEDIIREVALPMGLVDIKVCAVDDVWSGLKLVIRKELR